MVELRKRPAPAEPAQPAPKRGKSVDRSKAKAKPTTQSPAEHAAVIEKAKAIDNDTKVEATEETKPETTEDKKPKASSKLSSSSVGSKFNSSTALTTHKAEKTTIADLLSKSDKGIVVFTYPRASTPGCTTQACSFRDNYDDIRGKGWEVYGMSMDSVKANANFATKKEFGYLLLCDDGTVVGELGLKKGAGVARGVVVLAKDGEVKVWEQAGPARTLEVAKEFLGL